jgi:glycosyltransferase involved in cell wall biosynthesis
MIAVALSDEKVAALAETAPPPQDVPIRFISIGRLLAWKGFQYGLEAFAVADIPGGEYWIVGGGPAEKKLRGLATRLGIEDRVRFFGKVDYLKAMDRLAECHVLVHPSFRDSGGFVCLEAMAARRPVICLQRGGPAVQVTDQTGTVVSVISEKQIIEDMAQAMMRYAQDRSLCITQGQAGLQRVRECYTWNKKIAQLSIVFDELRRT